MAEKQEVADRLPSIIMDISGLPETSKEGTQQLAQAVLGVFTDTLKVTTEKCNIVSARRLLAPKEIPDNRSVNRPRLVHVRFRSVEEKIRVVSARSKLKGTKIFMNDDLNKNEREKNRSLLPRLKALQARHIKAVHFRRAVLFFEKQPLSDTKYMELLKTPIPASASDRMETSNPTSVRGH